jgi:hypothetical protein
VERKGNEKKGLKLFENLMQIIWQKMYLEIEANSLATEPSYTCAVLIGLPYSQHKKRGHFQLGNHTKEDISIVTVFFNKSPSQCISANSSLNLMGMQFKGRCAVY